MIVLLIIIIHNFNFNFLHGYLNFGFLKFNLVPISVMKYPLSQLTIKKQSREVEGNLNL